MRVQRGTSTPFIPLLLGVLMIALTVGLLAWVLTPGWPPRAACASDECKEAREWISSAITMIVLLAGVYSYWQAQLWKRAEFVAGQMKEFFAVPAVRNAMTMIDWSSRNVNLFDDEADAREHWPLVTRRMQSDALLPHTMVRNESDQVVEEIQDELSGFSREQAAIRDTFDEFLDGLERFGNHVRSGLLTAHDLRPYLGYWIDDIARASTNDPDGEWSCSLLAYIDFYEFSAVQSLFLKFGHDIRPGGTIFAGFLAQVWDPDRRNLFLRELEKKRKNTGRSVIGVSRERPSSSRSTV